MRRTIAALTCIAAVLPFGTTRAASGPATVAETLRSEVTRMARTVGMDPAAAMAAVQTFAVYNADGTTTSVTMTTDQIIARFQSIAAPAPRAAGPGLAPGVPETLAGDLTHIYVDAGFGIPARYSITSSALVPATPGATVADPVTGLPLFTKYDGPLRQVKGSGWLLGFHGAGYALGGINVDLAEGGPYVFANAAIITDESIDFIGNASVTQPCLFSFFGLCLVRAGILLGSGAALFDSTLPVGIPIVP